MKSCSSRKRWRLAKNVTIKNRRNQLVFTSVTFLFLAVTLLWPLANLFTTTLADVSISDLKETFARSSLQKAVRLTFIQAAFSTIAALAIGLPVAHVTTRYKFWGCTALRSITVVPFVIPTLVAAVAIRSTFDFFGVDDVNPLFAIVAAHVFMSIAIVTKIVGGFWATLHPALDEAAQLLGATPWRRFVRLQLRLLRPAIAAAATVIFLFSMTSFGVIRLLGRNSRTLETEIYRYAIARTDFETAGILALLQVVLVAVLAYVAARLQRRISTPRHQTVTHTKQKIMTWRQRIYVLAVCVSVVVTVIVPMAALVEKSLRVGEQFGLANYRRLSQPNDLLNVTPLDTLLKSLLFAAAATLLATAVAGIAVAAIRHHGSAARILETLVFLPLGVSSVALGFGYLVTFTFAEFRSSPWVLPLSHALLGLPLVAAAALPALRSINPTLLWSATTLGASPTRIVSSIVWPLTRQAFFAGALFAAAVSLGEFGAASFLSRSDTSLTAPLAIYRLSSQPGDVLRGQAMALSVTLAAIVGLLSYVAEKMRSARTASIF